MRPFTVKSEIVAVDKASRVVEKIRTAFERTSKSINKESNIAGNSFNRFVNQIGIGTKKASVALGNLNNRVSVLNKRIKSGIDGIFGTLGKVGIGIGLIAVLNGVATANVEVDKNLQSLSAITGVSGKQFENYKNEVFDASKQMKMFSGDMAKAFEVIGSQKPELLSSAESMKEVTVSAVTLSRASNEDLASSATNLTGIMNQFRLASNESKRTIDALAAGTIAGASSIAETGEAMKNFGTVAATSGMSLEKSIAAIQLLSLYQLKGAEAGTKARGALIRLQKAGLGYKSGVFDINDALVEAQMKYDKLGNAIKKDAFIEDVFGTENKVAGLILMQNVGRMDEMTRAVSERGKAEEMAMKNTNTFFALWQQIQASFKNTVTGIQSNSNAMNQLKDAMRWVADNMDMLISTAVKIIGIFVIYKAATIGLRVAQQGLRAVTFAYNVALGIQSALIGTASMAMKGNAVAIWVMNAATKTMTATTWLLSGGLLSATTAAWAFAAALFANPITWVVLGVVALIAGLVMLVKHFDKVKTAMIKTWDFIENNAIFKFLILPIYLAIKSVVLLVNGIKYLINNFDKVKAKTIEVFNTITGNPIIKLLLFPIWATISAIKYLIQNFGTIKETFITVFNSVWNLLKSIGSFFASIGRFIAAVFEYAWNAIASKALAAWNTIKGIFSKLFSEVSGVASKISEFFQPIVDFISNIGGALMDGIISRFKQIGEFVSRIIDTISNFFKTAKTKIDAKTEQIITINQQNKPAQEVLKNTEIVNKSVTESNKVIENEATKTKESDKLANALNANTSALDEETKVQKAKQDEWKGKFKTYIVRDANVKDQNITNKVAQQAIKNEENIITKQKEVLNETNQVNIVSKIAENGIKNEENVVNIQKEALKSNEINHINNIENQLNKTNSIEKQDIIEKNNITNSIAEKSIQNERYFTNIQKEIIKENTFTTNETNIENTGIVKQKSITTEQQYQPTESKNKRNKRDEITINVIDKTGSKFGVQVESTGIDLIRTGNA